MSPVLCPLCGSLEVSYLRAHLTFPDEPDQVVPVWAVSSDDLNRSTGVDFFCRRHGLILAPLEWCHA